MLSLSFYEDSFTSHFLVSPHVKFRINNVTKSISKLIIPVVKVYLVVQSGKYQRNLLSFTHMYCIYIISSDSSIWKFTFHIFQIMECVHDETTLAYTDHCISVSKIKGKRMPS